MIPILRLFIFTIALYPILQTEMPGFLRWSAEDLAGRQAVLSTRVGEDHSSRETLADYGNPSGAHRFRFIHRDADGVPEQHEFIEDVVFIQSGKAILEVGGELIDPAGRDGELRGSAITGAQRYTVGTGDILHIPADTPHRYLVFPGGQVTYVLVRIPVLTGEAIVREDAPSLDLLPPGFAMWTASELVRRHEALSKQVGPDRSARETLADYGSPSGSHRFRYIHRDANGVPEIHDNIIDVVFITSGEGELLVGGEMLDRTGSRGGGIIDGRRHEVSAGDMLHIPAKTPHGYLIQDGGHVTYVLVRVPAFDSDPG